MRIVVLGGTGMLGHKMYQALSAAFPETYVTVTGSGASAGGALKLFAPGKLIGSFDALDWPRCETTLRELRPNVIVNCIGIIKHRSDATSALPSIEINSLFPHRLAQSCAEWQGRLVHFSTDCVFSGERGQYKEDDFADARDLYGRTKYLGEVDYENALTLRTSIIGRELHSFGSLLEWFLGQQGKKIQGFTRALYSGVTTNHLAGVVTRLVVEHPELRGVYQVTGNTISKFDLLVLLREKFKVKVDISPNQEFFCDRSMVGERFQRATGYASPPWPMLADELVHDPTPYEEWR